MHNSMPKYYDERRANYHTLVIVRRNGRAPTRFVSSRALGQLQPGFLLSYSVSGWARQYRVQREDTPRMFPYTEAFVELRSVR